MKDDEEAASGMFAGPVGHRSLHRAGGYGALSTSMVMRTPGAPARRAS
jgi:hypothetical protein